MREQQKKSAPKADSRRSSSQNEKSNSKNSKNPKDKQKKYNPFPLFFQVVLSIVFSFTVIAGGAGYAYYKATGQVPLAQTEIINLRGSETTFFDTLLKKNIKVNIAVMGVDEDGTRTDTLFVVNYDSASRSIEMLSVPRDTRVTMADSVKTAIKEVGRSSPSVLKINEVHAYAGQTIGPDCTVMQLENLLGIQIDHYIKINTASFRALVDAVGGVDMYVPQNMYKNALEPNGGGIMINLKEGQQHLTGAQAEQLVRFRDYPEGDVTRVKTQQLFLEALASKVLSTQTLLNSIPDLINIAYEYIDTNLAISDALKYMNYIDQIDLNKITMETIPGVGQYVGGVSYYLHDANATEEAVQRIFFTSTPDPVEETSEDEDGGSGIVNSKDSTILVSNGSGVNGLAGEVCSMLEDDGYTVLSPATSNGTKEVETKIYVRSDNGVGEDLVKYFKNAVVEVAPVSVGANQDIHIILGTSEK